MPHLTHDNAVLQYWEQVKDSYPGVTLEQFKEICKAPPNYIRDTIRNKDKVSIMTIKYLGKFQPYKNGIQKRIKDMERLRETDPEYYDPKLIKAKEFLKKIHEHYKEFPEDAESRVNLQDE